MNLRGNSHRLRVTETLSFLFTDIEGSTALLKRLGADSYSELLAGHHEIVRAAITDYGGEEVGDPQGDGFFATFPSPSACAAAAVAMQRSLAVHEWPGGERVAVRMGIHSGEASRTAAGLVGFDVHRAARIAAVAHGGQVICSATTAQLVRDSLPAPVQLRDLGTHRLKDLGRPEQLYQLVTEGLRSEFPRLRSLDSYRHNLPEQLSSLVGREEDATQVREAVLAHRIVTLIGPGGVGKTRLALQVGADLLDEFEGGVWLAELAPLEHGSLVETAVAEALGVREDPLRPLEVALSEHLGAVRTLLLLDNCEHVLDDAAELVWALVGKCAGLHVVATSLEALRGPGEVVRRVEPLASTSLLEDGQLGSAKAPAVRLFLERSQAVDPAFAEDEDTLAAVTRLCQQLDGLPLAIELAAARAATFTPGQLEARIDDRFGLLTTGLRTAATRHRTLRAVVEWSVGLLDAPAQAVLERLSVFRGGLGLDAMTEVVPDELVGPGDLLEALSALVDHSLISVTGGGEGRRYRLLETIRVFGEERLRNSGALEPCRDRHLTWVETLSFEPGADSDGGQARWFALIDRELDNVRAALEWSACSPSRAGRGLAVASRLVPFWMAHGLLRYEGIRWVERLVRIADAPVRERVEALFGAGLLAALSWPLAALPLAEAASELAAGDAGAEAMAELLWAIYELVSGAPESARARLALAKREDDIPMHIWLWAASQAIAGTDLAAALEMMTEACERCLQVGDTHLAGAMRSFVAFTRVRLGDQTGASEAVDEARRLAHEFRCPSCTSMALTAGALIDGRPISERLVDLGEALRLSDEINETMTRVEALRAFAMLFGEQASHDRVAELHGAIEAVCRQSGYGLTLVGGPDGLAHCVRAARLALGDEAFEAASRVGASGRYADLARAVQETQPAS